jgi:AraC family transcriptional regulator of adaptative response/methylated-DNA-[protein]-cysteine methyltransferase
MSMGPRFVIRTAPVSLGHALLAATEYGVCYLGIASSEDALRADVARTFRLGRADGQQPNADDWLVAVCERIERPRTSAPMPPLDLRGSAFQRTVWHHLQTIPVGETRPYHAVAEALGRPGSSRAVAGACARNRVGILVPCHRVVRANGDLGGYHWGTEIKSALLAREGAGPAQPSETH